VADVKAPSPEPENKSGCMHPGTLRDGRVCEKCGQDIYRTNEYVNLWAPGGRR
jgi:hypothetical protein